MLHRFSSSIAGIALPKQFTYPFCYTPHPLCVLATEEVQHYLKQQAEWQEELEQGKMFGVLVVQTEEGETGYLAAFSGILAGKNEHPFFVPPVYDLLQPQGFFKIEEEQISQINRHIEKLEAEETYRQLKEQLRTMQQEAATELENAKLQMKASKAQREARRQAALLSAEAALSPEEEAMLIRESQYQKAEYKRMERNLKERIASLQSQIDPYEAEISQLKLERKVRSATLQQQLFRQFDMLNARGERKNLCDIFLQTAQKVPPAGAGECAAPKLLQQAYLHHWKPIAMAEFWWGNSPKSEIRHHGHYYPACKGKCEPILRHMLQGLDVEPNPLLQGRKATEQALEIVYEDPWIVVVNKPAGLLTVPGLDDAASAYSLMRKRYPQWEGPIIVHRLDMATSGLLVLAKTKQAHQHLQAQFAERRIKKRYIALLDGNVAQDSGIIDLPLCLNPLDRPRQVVDYEHGKPAVTRYEVLERKEAQTRIAFYPQTGRTHQLRVHAAHPLGLHCPIMGDTLYGKPADRLYLHAESLELTHPVSGELLHFYRKADF
ncbi:MAG: pseudouridine synthase [Bacteroides sp.]|nr:pseudouridine synthase [Bacteroides sp.]